MASAGSVGYSAWIYTDANRPGDSGDIEVIGTLADAHGSVVRRVTARDVSSRGLGILGFRADISLEDLTPGAYVLTMEARSGRRRDKPAMRQIPFTIDR